jgi:hypothetical protein
MKNHKLFNQESTGGSYPPPSPPPPPPTPPSSTGTSAGASSNAIIALVLGILSWIGCGILAAIPAWIVGKKEINAINAGQSPDAGKTMATIGMWLGIINVILSILAIIVFGILFALGLMGSIINN